MKSYVTILLFAVTSKTYFRDKPRKTLKSEAFLKTACLVNN